jgi:hypothetical protein
MIAKVTERVKNLIANMDSDELLNFIFSQKYMNHQPYDRSEIIQYAENYLKEYHVILP